LRQDASEPGSKQLHKLRRRLEANRLTMPMFDTKGWVRDFEKSLKAQWEVYANGLMPMHIVVARSDHVYGGAPFDRQIPGYQVI
jgi:protein O-GlcNAc transferase